MLEFCVSIDKWFWVAGGDFKFYNNKMYDIQ